MTRVTSLTEAVKEAATDSPSLTDAVKEAARSGAEHSVVSFPRLAFQSRRDSAVPSIRPVRMGAPAADEPRVRPDEPAGGDTRESRAEPAWPPAPDAPGRLRLRWRTGAPRRAALGKRRTPGLLASLQRALPDAAALRDLAQASARAARTAGRRLAGVILVCLVALVATPSPVGPDKPFAAPAQKRVALAIGNSAYLYTRKLDNPRNDATDVAAALTRLGFQVIEGHDLDKAGLDAIIREFIAHLHGADVGVFFYAGHGLHVSGRNYLVPVDAQLTTQPAFDLELVRLDLVHRTMEQEARTNILFFDACRDNPLTDTLARAMGTRSVEVGRGLGIVQGGAGTLISFSTQPGTLALDGKGRNSPYSAALVRQLATSREDLGTMLIAIRNEVMKETDRRQVPWEHSALTERFYFAPPAEAPAGAPVADARAREASEAWSAAKDTRSLAVLEAFIARYGETFYAELARARVAELRKTSVAPPLVDAPSFE
jgi:uncharacterized caspase-like protein